jgi:hypothetical protein
VAEHDEGVARRRGGQQLEGLGRRLVRLRLRLRLRLGLGL